MVSVAALVKNLPTDSLGEFHSEEPNSVEETIQSPGEQLSSQNRVIKNGPFEIHSFEIAPVVGKTEVFIIKAKKTTGLPVDEKMPRLQPWSFIDQSADPILSLNGFYYDSRFIDLDIHNGIKIFEIELNTGGKLLTSLVYKYKDGTLARIPVSTEKPGGYLGTVSGGGTEFIDTDSDGILEMKVFHRHYLPEEKRDVEVYKFDGRIFKKYKEYEETLSYVYY